MLAFPQQANSVLRSQMQTPPTAHDEPSSGDGDADLRVRVLLVEDNPGDAELVRAVLEQNVVRSVEVIQSSRLADAIARLDREPFHLIVLDLGLPDSKGLETLERMLKASKSIPVIVLTGREDLNLAQMAIRLGAQDCLCKNHVSGELLVRSISSSIERHTHLMAAIDRSMLDELTGLHNRRGLSTLASSLLIAARRDRSPLTLIYFDLDGMKQINDTLGHGSGDLALVETAEILRKTFGERDLICRIGGDEFAVLVAGAEPHSVDLLVRRFDVCLLQANKLPGHDYQLSVSIGVAHFDPERHRELDDVLMEADQRMYVQKKERHQRRSSQ